MPPSSSSLPSALSANLPAELPAELVAWSEDATRPALSRELHFKTFRQAFAFMTEVALEAERANHHPDWQNSYNKVSISLSTHSEKRITEQDFALAKKIERIYSRYT